MLSQLGSLLPGRTKNRNGRSEPERESSPRALMRQVSPESYGGDPGGSPRLWQWKQGALRIPRAKHNINYAPLKTVETEPEEEEMPTPASGGRRPSAAQMLWVEAWLENVESGELDVYTCLALSNMFTWSPDTQKLAVKVLAVTVLQIVVPCVMLYLETLDGLSWRMINPAESGKGFRMIGSTLYLYSVYVMYTNASDECRSRLLNFCFRYKVPPGYWVPLVLGEVSNVLVSSVLVITLYIIYTHLIVPADLILNAVAVNFLGSVDAEFVNEDMKKDAVKNFKEITDAVLCNPVMNTHADEDAASQGKEDTFIGKFVSGMLYGIVGVGVLFAVVFFFAPTSRENAGFGGVPAGRGHAFSNCEEKSL